MRNSRIASRSDSSVDRSLLFVVATLTIFGIVMIYSGSVLVAVKIGKSPFHFFSLQILWTLVGSIAGYILYKIDYRYLSKLAVPGFIISFISLIATLLINWNNPIKRWIQLGPFNFQPSEMAKLILLVYLSSWLAKKSAFKGTLKEHIEKTLFSEIIPFFMILGVIAIPILVEPDLDTTLIIIGSSLILLFISGSDYIHTIITSISSVLIGVLGYVAIKVADYRMSRFNNWLLFWFTGDIQNPFGSGYQLRQILVAVASGGLWGLGFGESRQKFHYLGNTAFTDTIFAIIAEEFGLIGATILILLFLYVFLRGIKIAKNAPDKLGFLLAISIISWITLQAFMHIAANLALIPINGNTLPFLSYGGSSTLVNLSAFGILLNISKHSKNPRSG